MGGTDGCLGAGGCLRVGEPREALERKEAGVMLGNAKTHGFSQGD